MKTISEYNNQVEKLKNSLLSKSNELDCGNLYYFFIYLESVEENIALWRKENIDHSNRCYFYSDLNGNLLFNGKRFKYATPFSNLRACVNDYKDWFILDIGMKEIVYFPECLIFESVNKLRDDKLSLFDASSFKWGGIEYNSLEKSFQQTIPFIWDVLEFSRLDNQVYVGIYDITFIYDSNLYFNWNDDFKVRFNVPVMKLSIDDIKDVDYYNYIKNIDDGFINEDMIRYIKKDISSNVPHEKRKKMLQDYLRTSYNVGDCYFGENCFEKVNNNTGKIVDIKDISGYQKKIGKIV